ncbi:MAG: carboxypeptidase regulatory-like domain-containing protein [Candidatus Marinimicrobia bacterium]|nr:carboxypeptidase regulatory-like domain-containing protein [Candidatus Neomarinimicrobiota bacterium]
MINKKIISLVLFAFVLQSACEEDVTLPTAQKYGSLSGTVKDAETSEPIAGALVEAVVSQVTDTADSMGAFFLDSLLVGDESINILAGFYDSQILEITITPDSQTLNVAMMPMVENQYLYVAEALGHNIYIVDVDRHKEVDSLYFSEGEIARLFITPGGTKLYIYVAIVKKIFYFDSETRTL